MGDNANLEKQRLLMQFVAFILGVAVTVGSYVSLVFFQSSFNIESGVGITASATSYMAGGLFTIIGTPVVIQEVGAKTAIVACHFGYLAYDIANFYPNFYTMIPGALLVGVGEAMMWPLVLLFSVHFARCYSRLQNKPRDFYQAKFLGCLWFAFKLAVVFCGLISYGILYAGKAPDASVVLNGTRSQRLLRVCGINDCQDSNLTALNIDQYAPDPRTTYIVIGVIVALTLGGAIDHGFVLKKLDRSLEEKTRPKKQSRSLSVLSFGENIMIQPTTGQCAKIEEIAGETQRKIVGLCAAVYNMVVALGGLLTGELISSFGRIKPQMFAVLLCLTNYILLLTWTPTAESTWMVYCLFALMGVVDSIWNVSATDLYAAYFPNNQDTAYSLWSLWYFCGYAIQFAWSTSICVREKIYVQIALLLFATACYLYAEFREQRNKST